MLKRYDTDAFRMEDSGWVLTFDSDEVATDAGNPKWPWFRGTVEEARDFSKALFNEADEVCFRASKNLTDYASRLSTQRSAIESPGLIRACALLNNTKDSTTTKD